MQKPPVETHQLFEYRTIDSIQLVTPSRNLIDTIHEMEAVQEWMIDFRKDRGFDQLPIVGSVRGNDDIYQIARQIRMDVGLAENWHKKCKNTMDAIKLFRELLEQSGIIVMMNGIVGQNTHRSLNIEEFRAFAMVDKWAPLIFINGADSKREKLFSLFHEAVHIWLGENNLYNDRGNMIDEVRESEKICNAVASELLVPQMMFIERWRQDNWKDVYEKIQDIARYFHCSESVVARKALDQQMIPKPIYSQVVTEAIENDKKRKESKHTGGNYYHTMGSRLDGSFVRALCESINLGRTNYTEAYRLTNTNRKTFSKVATRLGGMEW